jgi:hypothetical protein
MPLTTKTPNSITFSSTLGIIPFNRIRLAVLFFRMTLNKMVLTKKTLYSTAFSGGTLCIHMQNVIQQKGIQQNDIQWNAFYQCYSKEYEEHVLFVSNQIYY